MTDTLTETDTAILHLRNLEERLAATELKLARVQEERASFRRALIDEAVARSWCDDLNTFLEDNGMERWEIEYQVSVSYTTHVTLSGCGGGENEDEAINVAWERMRDDRWNGEIDFSVDEVSNNRG